MAQYKVPQDVEAEDKLLGPFTFRQFVYLLIAAAGIAGAWGLAQIFIPLALIPLPAVVFFGVLALPLKKDQPMEVYLAALVSFYVKPRLRFWRPGQRESTILITAPKKIEKSRTRNLSEDEASHRLSFLAEIVDTEGYAIRNDSSMQDEYAAEADNVQDILEADNPVIDQMIEKEQEEHKQKLISQMRTAMNRTDAVVNDRSIQAPGAKLNQQQSVPAQSAQPGQTQSAQSSQQPSPAQYSNNQQNYANQNNQSATNQPIQSSQSYQSTQNIQGYRAPQNYQSYQSSQPAQSYQYNQSAQNNQTGYNQPQNFAAQNQQNYQQTTQNYQTNYQTQQNQSYQQAQNYQAQQSYQNQNRQNYQSQQSQGYQSQQSYQSQPVQQSYQTQPNQYSQNYQTPQNYQQQNYQQPSQQQFASNYHPVEPPTTAQLLAAQAKRAEAEQQMRNLANNKSFSVQTIAQQANRIQAEAQQAPQTYQPVQNYQSSQPPAPPVDPYAPPQAIFSPKE